MNPPLTQDLTELLDVAAVARGHAYAPYSSFKVGAALRTSCGRIVTGCNVENLSYGLTLCAERNAITSAVAQGFLEFRTMVVIADTRRPISPCGACRQFLVEFSDATEIVMATTEGLIEYTTIADLLPRSKTGILDKD